MRIAQSLKGSFGADAVPTRPPILFGLIGLRPTIPRPGHIASGVAPIRWTVCGLGIKPCDRTQ